MAQALALAAFGEGATSPNPCVGCVVVRDGRAVGLGFHRAAGLPHAEAEAIADAGDRARGATVYVNLEPCDHHGRTPPCTELLIRSGARRVVAAIRDPNPLVNGSGFERLRAAGIEVATGVLQDESREINAGFLSLHERGRPVVTLKAALSLDGRIAAAGGRSRWITGATARRLAHRLRLAHDAVLVGAGTVRRDDPRLTVRLPGVEGDPWRVVLSATLDLPPEAQVFASASGGRRLPLIFTALTAPREAEAALRGRAEVVRVRSDGGRLDLGEILALLADRGVLAVLVEGGARTHAAFVEAGLADRAAIFVAPALLGEGGSVPFSTMASPSEPAAAWRVEVRERAYLGEDLLVQGRLIEPARRHGPARA